MAGYELHRAHWLAHGHHALALLACGVAGFVLCGCAGPGRVPAPNATIGQPFNRHVTSAVLDAPLVASNGQRLTLASFAGKVLVISDFMSLCQESCPMDTANVVAAARAVERAGLGNKVEFVSITVDPHRDTPIQLAAYRKLYGPAPADWMVLTGSPAVLDGFWKDLGVYIHKTVDKPPFPHDWRTGKPLQYDISHSDDVFFLDGSGDERFLLAGIPYVAKDTSIPTTLLAFMDAEGHQNLAQPPQGAWTVPQELQVLSWLVQRRITIYADRAVKGSSIARVPPR
ncbi:MAG: SCO family protein [Rhodanobacteraceae bacterium]